MTKDKQAKDELLTIQWLEDEYDCDLCGSSYATGAIVQKGEEIILELEPVAHCYDSESWDKDEVYKKLKELGYERKNLALR